MANNDVVLRQFVEDAKLKTDDFGRSSFEADVLIKAQGSGGLESAEVRVSFANGDNEQVQVEETGSLVAGKVPLGYNTDFGTWSTASGVLRIKGTYKRVKYETTITPS